MFGNIPKPVPVVADTTKVQIFKQITTDVPQTSLGNYVVADTTKVQIFKQITTRLQAQTYDTMLLLIPQRYKFSSKSQPDLDLPF